MTCSKFFRHVLIYLLVNQVHGAPFKAAAAVGDSPMVAHSGTNDRHKFGGVAEHALTHTWESRKLQGEGSPTNSLSPGHFCADKNSLYAATNEYLDGTLTTTTNPTSIEYWDVSCVTDMEKLFYDAMTFNADIGGWDVSSVTYMDWMFSSATAFNADIGRWDVSSVTVMGDMFSYASAFNVDIGGWDVSSVTSMVSMFIYADAFNVDIGGWDVSSVTTMDLMFSEVYAFNVDIGGWDVSFVTEMEAMFRGADAFNADIGGWDVSSVTTMDEMFYNAAAFNATIGGWDVSFVTEMEAMFRAADAFNADIGGWDVSSVTVMGDMFKDALAFNVDICGWDVSSVTTDDISYFTSCCEANEYLTCDDEGVCECAPCPLGTTNEAGHDTVCHACVHDIETCLETFSNSLTCLEKDGGAVDLFGDGCEWYETNPGGCGFYDDDDFIANDMCCACAPCMDSNEGALDSYNDGCEWYENNLEHCGYWDNDDFIANDMCCACGGGGRARYSAEPEIDDICPDSVDPTEESCLMAFPEELTKFCEDTVGDTVDSYGDGCEWYDEGANYRACGYYDTYNTSDDFIANDMCCACKGGTMEGKTRKKSPGVGSVVIIVPVVIGAVFLAAGAYAVARKRKTVVAQRRLSHSVASMPSVVAE